MKNWISKINALVLASGVVLGIIGTRITQSILQKPEDRPVPVKIRRYFEIEIDRFRNESDPRRKIQIADQLLSRYERVVLRRPPTRMAPSSPGRPLENSPDDKE